jgi:hypothetical protein
MKDYLSIFFYIGLLTLLLGLISQFIWNTIVSDIFSIRQISLLESILINLLFRIYFQSFSIDKD